MLESAIAKLKEEIEKSENNTYVQAIGDFLIQHVKANPETAEKILNENKTILKSLDEMKNVAMKKITGKKKSGDWAVLTDAEGFAIVLKYFEIEGNVTTALSSNMTAVVPDIEASEVKPKKAFNVKLEDLL